MARTSRSAQGKRPFRGLALATLITLAIAAVVVQGAPGVANVFMPVRTSAGDLLVTGPTREASQEPGWLAHLTGQAVRERRIRELEARVEELSRYEMAARSMALRLEAYEELLSAVGEPPAKGATGRVVTEVSGPFSETLLANVGRAQGVELNSIAVNAGGVVGRVTHLGERSSRILLVTDYNSRVPVLGENSGVRAIVYGEGGVGRLSDKPEDDAFLPGERILTSGDGGVFPRGLLVGRVVAGGGETRVAFSMSQTRGGFVRLIPPTPIAPPEADLPLPEVEAVADVPVADGGGVQ